MTAGGRRFPDEMARLKNEAKNDQDESFEYEDDQNTHKRRRPWKDEHRRQDRQSKKQRQRNPEWND